MQKHRSGRWTGIALAGLASIALAGCAGMELGKVENMSPGGSQFTKSLYSNYVDLSRSEFGEGDYRDSDRFAMQAKGAAEGQNVAPFDTAKWQLPADRAPLLTTVRNRLVAALDGGGREKAPDAAAKAQAMFDCWVQEQEENFQPKDIARCQADFSTAMSQVEKAIQPKVAAAPPPKPAPQPVKKVEKPKPDAKRWVVYFDFDKAGLTNSAKTKIAEAAAYAKQVGEAKLLVIGHTDRSGADSYNDKLSAKRADQATLAIMDLGIDPNKIQWRSLGETQPAMPTSDGMAEPANRRVEIVVTPK